MKLLHIIMPQNDEWIQWHLQLFVNCIQIIPILVNVVVYSILNYCLGVFNIFSIIIIYYIHIFILENW